MFSDVHNTVRMRHIKDKLTLLSENLATNLSVMCMYSALERGRGRSKESSRRSYLRSTPIVSK